MQIVSKHPGGSNGDRFTVLGQAGHADPLDGWRCSSYKQVMSRQIQVGQLHTNKSGFAISAINMIFSVSYLLTRFHVFVYLSKFYGISDLVFDRAFFIHLWILW